MAATRLLLLGVFAAVLFLLLAGAARGFYLPGVAPADFRKVRLRAVPLAPSLPLPFLLMPALRVFVELTTWVWGLQKDPLAVKVSQLSSTKTQLPYSYYSLPFCRPDAIVDSAENLGELLRGDRIENSPYLVS